MGYVRDLDEVDRTQVDAVGGKGAQLGELARIGGVTVPAGFCVTTEAFRLAVAGVPAAADVLERLSRVAPDDREAVRALSAQLRDGVETAAVPDPVTAAIGSALARFGAQAAYAVRSSATAEDLPTASFAGQHDSYPDVAGLPAVVAHVRRCWASLYTERAVTYRLRNGVDHRRVQMAVVVQRMVTADAAGVLFTADPVTGNRTVVTVEAVTGPGEALMSGRVPADSYAVGRDGVVTASVGAPPVLTTAQVRRLAQLGRLIEARVGHPQDIEWCLADGGFQIVQSRAITTLFPVPPTADRHHRVYLSVGHQQMMTDPMTPLGLSIWQLTTPRPMSEAGGRLFVDVTGRLASPAGRDALLDVMGRSDPLMRDALQTVLDRGFVPVQPATGPGSPPTGGPPTGGPPAGGAPPPIDADPALVTALIRRSEASVATLRHDIGQVSGPALFDVILADLEELRRVLFDPSSLQVITAAMDATRWLDDHLEAWLGEPHAADALAQSAPGNVTSEMGLALLDVADAIRPYPEVVAVLQHVDATGHDDVLGALAGVAGGAQARDALDAYLAAFGMRGVGEIDIARPRFREQPATLVPAILGHVANAEPGAGPRRFEQGRQRAVEHEKAMLSRVLALPDGERKAAEVRRNIDRVRTFIGYREYPKYGMVNRYFVYKQALLREADRLVRAGVLPERDDIFFLRFDELHEVARTGRADVELIRRRQDDFRSYRALRPPRVLTSDGEAVTGSYRRDDLPPGALAGLPVSAGTVEGRARVVLDLAHASDLRPGDILVTSYTDPSWTPLFVAVGGLVTEVGGLMTHGAVIAREYGLPAVVGVEGATRLIRDGQRIRLHATAGYVEIVG